MRHYLLVEVESGLPHTELKDRVNDAIRTHVCNGEYGAYRVKNMRMVLNQPSALEALRRAIGKESDHGNNDS